MKSITVEKLLGNNKNYQQVTGNEESLKRVILTGEINRPGFELAGFFKHSDFRRIIVFGDKEMAFIAEMTEERQKEIFPCLINEEVPCIVICKGHACPEVLKNIADFIHADESNILFTSGGSASNTLAVKGYKDQNDCVILYSPIAHKSILNYVKTVRSAIPLKVNGQGEINFDDLKSLLSIYHKRSFVVIDYANSEIGTIQYVKKLTDLIHFYNGKIYVDCTGSISQIPLDVKKLDIDIAGFSAHKLGSLKGCGVLYKKDNIQLSPIIYGSQEHGLFGGTENTLGILTLGYVVKHYNYDQCTSEKRNYLVQTLSGLVPNFFVVGPYNNRLPYNLFLCFEGVSGEALMTLLHEYGVIVSTGSACNSGSLKSSDTLLAIGMKEKYIHNGIRLTLCGSETKEELDYICNQIKNCVMTLRNLT